MSLRPDSIYSLRVDRRHLGPLPSDPGGPSHAQDHPPLQLRLTEEALIQLAAAFCESESSSSSSRKPSFLRIHLDGDGPSLRIGSSAHSLHQSAESTPHEICCLNRDETTLIKLGSLSKKLSVRPSSVGQGMASRLKERREEEDLRREERRKAVMLDNPSVANSKKSSQKRREAGFSVHPAGSQSKGLLTTSVSPLSSLRERRELGGSQSGGRPAGVEASSLPSGAIIGAENRPEPGEISTNRSSELGSLSLTSTHLKGGESSPLKENPTGSVDRVVSHDRREEDENPSQDELEFPGTRQVGLGRTRNFSPASTLASERSTASLAPRKGKLSTRQRLAKAAKGKATTFSDSEKLSKQNQGKLSIKEQGSPRSSSKGPPAAVDVNKDHRPGSSLMDSPNLSRQGKFLPVGIPATSTTTSKGDVEERKKNDAERSRHRELNERIAARKQSRSSVPRRSGASTSLDRGAEESEASCTELPSSKRQKMGNLRESSDLLKQKVNSSSHSSRSSSSPLPFAQEELPSIPKIVHRSEPTHKGVGPGAARLDEPWLDLRSRSDWHRLSQRFQKTYEEYECIRRRLDHENSRLESERAKAIQEVANEQRSTAGAKDGLSPLRRNPEGERDGLWITMRGRDSKAGGDLEAEDSHEEGQMSSEDEPAEFKQASALGLSTSVRTDGSSSSDGLVWRGEESVVRRDDSPQLFPMAFSELSELVDQQHNLHGCLQRMKKALREFSEV
ncbi:hypothetical protein IE53DRAFT_160664 [Violaceomyces palustris]|uniref:Uncharacterized protein n=1 Tax=Violaceomyces palustris TaxID=1673888 RepID=A0ACD0NTK9_9BASI|nr:hypothetical protein IE53DRAFT_160664 [Violaceomyces palustris]